MVDVVRCVKFSVRLIQAYTTFRDLILLTFWGDLLTEYWQMHIPLYSHRHYLQRTGSNPALLAYLSYMKTAVLAVLLFPNYSAISYLNTRGHCLKKKLLITWIAQSVMWLVQYGWPGLYFGQWRDCSLRQLWGPLRRLSIGYRALIPCGKVTGLWNWLPTSI
jgi:hypothetical protein